MNKSQQQLLAIFLPALNGGGAERQMLNLACGIAERGYAVDLVLAQRKGPYLKDVPKSVRLIDLKTCGTYASLPKLIPYLNNVKPEVMISALCRANIVALWARRLARVSTRIVLSERNTLSCWAKKSRAWNQRLTLQFAMRFYHWADAITAVSKGVADDLSQMTKVCREHIKVIYNPVVTPEMQRKMQAPLDHPWFQPGEPPVVLAVGSLTEQKDFRTVIQAFAKVQKTHSVRLLIFGEGRQRPELEKLVAELGIGQDVSLPGRVENPYPFMVRAALFVLCSRWEGLPGVLIEALFCGTPLVATDCPSGPREILADGKYGHLVPVGDVAALTRAIEAALGGKPPPPPHKSWLPYELKHVVSQYIPILFRRSLCDP
jgi:glycosyltransferase involved in cell wall biosynthesis